MGGERGETLLRGIHHQMRAHASFGGVDYRKKNSGSGRGGDISIFFRLVSNTDTRLFAFSLFTANVLWFLLFFPPFFNDPATNAFLDGEINHSPRLKRKVGTPTEHERHVRLQPGHVDGVRR